MVRFLLTLQVLVILQIYFLTNQMLIHLRLLVDNCIITFYTLCRHFIFTLLPKLSCKYFVADKSHRYPSYFLSQYCIRNYISCKINYKGGWRKLIKI